MDFLIGLVKSKSYDFIIVFSKHVNFIATLINCTMKETKRLFLKHMVKF